MNLAPRGVVYAGFATRRHSGGVHVMTEHVRLLRQAGVDASMWLPGEPPAPPWFDPAVPVRFGDHLDVAADDLLVLPEVPVLPGVDPAPGARAVLLNQNHFYTYAAPGWAPDARYPGWRQDPAVWSVSVEAVEVLTALHPHLDVRLVPDHVDGELFRPVAGGPPSVVWMPRKRPREAALLRGLLAADPRLAGVRLEEITDRPRAEVAETLGTATVFVALGHSEGFGLPVAEALAAGCLVVGYDGGGGHELFEAPGAWAVPEQRPLLLRDRVVDLVARRDELAPVSAANRAWVRARYPRSATARTLVEAVSAAADRPGRATRATHPAAWVDALGPSFTAFA